MKFIIVYSKKDEAGVNIAKALKNFYIPQIPVIELSKDSIYSENIDEEETMKNFDFIIFATKHQSKENRNTLSLHAPGNWRNADFGGSTGKLCKSSALVLKYLFGRMSENLKESKINYELTLESTHHGPLLNKKPCCFIEIGTTSEQWNDPKAAEVIAKTLSDLQNFLPWHQKNKKQLKIAFAIGGPHYCPNFNKIQLSANSNIAIGHIIPEYHLPLTEHMIKEAIEKTSEHLELAILDWKGCGNSEQRQNIINLLERFDLKYERTDKVEK